MDNATIRNTIERFVKTYAQQSPTNPRWKRPIIGFASSKDPLFHQLKKIVGPGHILPQDLLGTCKTVIAYFLPFEGNVQKSNAKEKINPSRSWAVAYIETNRLIEDLNNSLKVFLEESRFRTVFAPVTHNYEQEILLSDWSHSHVGYITALGRFGRNRWLITKNGCCGMLGSLVTEASFTPTSRPEEEFCLHFAGYECTACINKCFFDALFLDRFDRHACNRQLLKNAELFSDLEMSDVCGKCGCGVPCSFCNPVAVKEGWRVIAHP